MTLYMPPLTKKKPVVNERLSHDTKRIFSNYDDELGTSVKSHSQTEHSGQCHPSGVTSRIVGRVSPTRQNNPHPSEVNFLLQDCKVLHQPICHVKTKVKLISEDEKHWWPSRTSQEAHKVPKYSHSSNNRADYRAFNKVPPGQTRYGSNPHIVPATGIVPVNHLPSQNGPRLLVERISYSHGYNSRNSPNQPQRGKLHGHFVWDILHPVNSTTSAKSSSQGSPPKQAKVVQVSSTMSVLKPSEETSCTREQVNVVGLGTMDSTLPFSASTLPTVAR